MKAAFFSRRVDDWGADTTDLLNLFGKTNPFFTAGYSRAMQALGREVWIIGSRGEPPADLALGFIRRHKLVVELEFVSAPRAAATREFWEEVGRLARSEGITDITVGTFGSPSFALPALPGEVSRQDRQEFLLPLEGVDLLSLLSSNHKRNAKKAQKAEMTIRRSGKHPDWLTHHAGLMSYSAERRVARGESVTMAAEMNEYRAFLQHGAAELFQAVRDTEVFSSVLVLKAPLGGYYQSAGTSAEGMSAGASHFLIHGITKMLQEEGCLEFNLGGAPDGSSLARFKQGFGPHTVTSSSAVCYVGPLWKRYVRRGIQMLRTKL